MITSFENLLEGLAQAKVDFILVGGLAVCLNGFVRMTEHMDILVDNAPANDEDTPGQFQLDTVRLRKPSGRAGSMTGPLTVRGFVIARPVIWEHEPYRPLPDAAGGPPHFHGQGRQPA